WLGAIAVVLLTSLQFMSTFSRGSGLMPALMLIGYIGRWRRIPVVGASLATLFFVYAGHVGLSGRGIYGHFAGLVPYFEHFMSGADFDWWTACLWALGGGAVGAALYAVFGWIGSGYRASRFFSTAVGVAVLAFAIGGSE